MPPASSATTQSDPVGHEIAVGSAPSFVADARPRSICTGADHPDPSQRAACPRASTAVHLSAPGHETPVNADVAPRVIGSVQDPPFHFEIPFGPADMQSSAETHEIDFTEPQSPEVRSQTLPTRANAFPSPSIAAQ
jgi:hypothetical protein